MKLPHLLFSVMLGLLPLATPAAEPPIRVLILDGYSNHDWRLTTALIRGIIEPTGLFTVAVSTAPATKEAPGWDEWHPKFSDYDAVIQTCNDGNSGAVWPRAVQEEFEKFVSAGGGAYVWHAGNNAFAGWPAYNDMIGLGWRSADFGVAISVKDDGTLVTIPAGEGSKTSHGPRVDTVVHRRGDHPIHAGLPRAWKTPDIEIYHHARGPAKNIEVLSYGFDPRTQMNWPLEWTVAYGTGRVYTSTFGHVWKGDTQPERMRCAGLQTVVVRALQWLAHRTPDFPVPADFPTAEITSIRAEIKLPTASTADPALIADGGNAEDFDMAPETRLEVVEAAVATLTDPLPAGPFAPTWESLREHYRVPAWFNDAKFGLFLHWGLYAVPAYHNEWYEKHMYASLAGWHGEHFGPQAKFGYKDFIPLFTCEKFDAAAWADLFRRSGARFVIPTAQHHDNFALWDSAVTPFNAKAMGPGRDLIGELAAAVRRQGLKFGVSNHGIENFQFINPTPELRAELEAKQADLFDRRWTGFYNVADRSDDACRRFLVDWYRRNVELIEKYEPDMLWFDNGVDQRFLDPLKLRIAAYYYNRAAQRGQAVSLSTKKAAYAPTNRNSQTIGSIMDFEKIGKRSPAGIRTGAWQVDEPIGSTWGYTKGMRIAPPGEIVAKLADTVSKGGTLLLNLSPQADGTIPAAQQETLLGIGRWLDRHGEAIYGSHAWTTFGYDRADRGQRVRFTVRGDALYAILLGPWSGGEILLPPVVAPATGPGRVASVTMLGTPGELAFLATPEGLHISLSAAASDEFASVLKITGLILPPASATVDGNPR